MMAEAAAIELRHRRRVELRAIAIAVMACMAAAPVLAAVLDTAVKATYLYKLVPFVEWPADAFASPDSPFRFCVVGSDIGKLLHEAVDGRSLDRHPFAVSRLGWVVGADHCAVVFIGIEDTETVAALLAGLRGSPTLTVTNMAGASPPKGIINFILRQDHVRFEIDDQAAKDNGLTISSKLLELAAAVRRRR